MAQDRGQVAGICICGNETSYFINWKEFLEKLRNGILLKKDSAPFSKVSNDIPIRNELTTSHRGDPPTRMGCLRSRQREVRRLIT
jgi:hypothetical protein